MTRRKSDHTGQPNRRELARILLGLGSATAVGACGDDTERAPQPEFLLPPPSAEVQTTACAYCIVGCGYKAYTWPVAAASGGPAASENALGVDFPVGANGPWIAPSMHAIAMRGGEPYHVAIVPDRDARVVNVGGDYNLGGSLAQRFYQADGATADRLLRPQLRVDGELRPISWDDAIAILARVSRHVVEAHGVTAWGMKSYSYQFYENTYAITKLCFDAIKTPCWAPHDQPADGPSTPGLSDCGINAFSAAYQDWRDADVLFVSGVGLVEQRAVLFSQWVEGGPSLIVVNPRRDETADYALEHVGMFLQINPGTDTLLHHAIAYAILENGWEDSEFIAQWCVSDGELVTEGANARRARFGLTYAGYRAFILGDARHQPEAAAAVIGVPAEQIREAARRMAQPVGGVRPRTSLMLEKGNYWSHNYANSASLASLGILVGAGNRPGRMISRGGGHQRGMISAAPYPTSASPAVRDGVKVPLNLDHWLLAGNLRLAWVVGCTWIAGGSAHTAALYEQVRQQTTGPGLPRLDAATAFPSGDRVDVDAVVARLRARVDAGGLVFVQQDIYPQATTELADLVLPAASWGEAPFTRMQGERRLRHYAHLVDAPGECRPDWQIIADVARAMGYAGFDWPDGNAVFEEASRRSVGTEHDYLALVELARERGQRAHDFLAALGTEGIQCPIRREGGALVGTTRLHESGFGTATKKTLFLRTDLDELVAPRLERFAPRADEMWIINRRMGSTWSSMVEDRRIPFRAEQLPENLLELHPDDASRLGIANGDLVDVAASDLLDPTITTSQPITTGSFRARAVVIDVVRPGVACTYFNFGGTPDSASNSVVPNDPDPVSGMYSFKLGRARITRAS